jgi:NADH:ubiquinone oxidoreductase subunit 2 (subunit N)
MLVGTLGAINQKKIKRSSAYSSIAHVGYLLIGLATGTIEAVESLLIYIAVYIVTATGAFGTILAMSRDNYHSFGRAGFGFTGSLPHSGGNQGGNVYGGMSTSFIYSLKPEQLEEKMK